MQRTSQAGIAPTRDPGLKHWHSDGDLLCWPSWLQVEHLDDNRRVDFNACRPIRSGNVKSISAPENHVLIELGLLD
jgi:hypothetical protein